MSASGRLLAALSLAGAFAYDLVAASLAVARIVLAPRRRNEPAIVAVPVDARTDWGVALFAYLVSMTPGSTCLHVADDRRTLYVHFLDAPDREARAADVKALYERRIIQMEGREASQ
ncbi:MAG TPA: Na+/H+ antiporter subunit E [Gemmatimonadaceae bacterium]|jgi:multisubunit Na+/H+ antiporter MnhE subunit|nr:Na+/H+ antiporter subunit E [Gemmatimonadaceae bacterium]